MYLSTQKPALQISRIYLVSNSISFQVNPLGFGLAVARTVVYNQGLGLIPRVYIDYLLLKV